MVFQCINIRQVPLGDVENCGLVFNTSHGTWRMLVHEKPCLMPILDSTEAVEGICDQQRLIRLCRCGG